MAAQPAAASAALGHRHSSRVVLLGVCGGPPPEIDRAGIASALVIGDRVYVIDCGRGAVTQYAQARLAFNKLRGIFVTHLHADHVIDFYDFMALPEFGD
jgi:ribonuclease BN (tRNA processing enzyme)